MMRSAHLYLLLLIFLGMPFIASSATYTWIGPAGGNWTTPGNWDVGINYPGFSGPGVDDAVINAAGATPNLDATVSITGLVLTNGSLLSSSGGNSLTVTGVTTLNGIVNFAGASDISLNDISLTGNSQINTATGDIDINGTVNGGSNLDLDAGSGNFLLDPASYFGNTIVNLSFATTSATTPFNIPTMSITGNLTVNMPNVNFVYNEDNVAVGGNADITSNLVVNLDVTNLGTVDFGTFTFSTNNVQLDESSATDLAGGTSTNINIISAGAISNSGDLIIAGTSTFTAPNGADIILQSAGNQFVGNVTFNSAGNLNNVRVVDTDGTGFNVQAALTIGGNLNLNVLGDVVFLGSFTTAGNPVDLTAAGAITATLGALNISAGVLNLDSGNASAVTLSNAGNDFGTVATAGEVGDTYIVDANDIILGNMNTGADDLRINAGGAITQTAATAITTNGLALEGTGPVELMEANQFDVLAVNVTNQVDVRDSDGDGFDLNTVLTVNQAAASTLVLQNDAGTVTQTNAIASTNLLLTGAGAFTLTNASNAIATLASDATGAISYTDTNSFSVGSVTTQAAATVNGIISGGANVTLESVTAGIAVNQPINAGAGAGDVLITAQGASSQAGAAPITADGLEFYGAGPFDFSTAANDATELAGDMTGLLNYYDSNGFAIFNLESPPDGLWSTADIILNSDGPVTQNGDYITAAGLLLLGAGPYDLNDVANDVDTLAVNVTGEVDFADSDDFVLGAVQGVDLVTTGADLVLDAAAGVVTQTREIQLAAGNLLLSGAAAFTLTDVNNSIGAIASNATGNISYTDVANIDVGSVTDLDAATVNGITSAGGNVTLTALAGGAAVNQIINTGAGNLTVTTTGGDITQGVGDTITSAGIATLTAGAGGNLITLNTNVNDFGTLEATGSTVRIQELNALVLNNITATIFDLDADGAVTQNGGTSIQAANVRFLGNGNFTLTQANDADTIAGNIGDFLTFTDADDLTVGSVLGTNGITTTGDT
ncbi:MAG: hypothetical protein P1P77_07585, partial [Spirochaetaceae bacterium]|nr:hypothetical protein [Spirochaetaceae bacterium]